MRFVREIRFQTQNHRPLLRLDTRLLVSEERRDRKCEEWRGRSPFQGRSIVKSCGEEQNQSEWHRIASKDIGRGTNKISDCILAP